MFSLNCHTETDFFQSYVEGLPVVAFRFSDTFQKKYPEIEQRWIQTLLRVKGWIVPNYELPPTLDNVQILRVVVKEHVSEPVGCDLILLM